MKICILSNSHASALKRAWDCMIDSELKEKFSITFFAARGQRMRDLQVDGKSLIPGNQSNDLKSSLEFTSNGLSSIDLEEYDILLIYGVGIAPYFASDFFYSSDAMHCSLADNYQSSIGYKLLTMIRESVASKVYLGHNPLPTDEARDDVESTASISDQYIEGIRLANELLFNELNCELVNQPQQTLVGDNRNTHSNYSKGSKRLGVGVGDDSKNHASRDNIHMNDEFGKIWLDAFLKKIDESSRLNDSASL